MRVVISCGGKWTSFEQASELERRGNLSRLLTTYYSQKRGLLPEMRRDSIDVDPKNVSTYILPEAIKRAGRRLPILRHHDLAFYLAAEAFDRWAARRVDDCDILLAWASFGLRSMRQAKKMGAVTVLNRGGAHVLARARIVAEEFEQAGISADLQDAHPRLIDKNVREYEEADYILVPSRFVADTFLPYGIPEEKLRVVHQAVDLSPFSPVPKEDDVFRVVYVGRLALVKGVHHLLEAFHKLQLPNSELVLIGNETEEMRPFMERYAGNYRYVGPVPHAELYRHYSQGSVFVSASLPEALGATVMEAMACGLPVVCTATGAAEVVRDGRDGYVVPIGDVDALADRLRHLYENQRTANEMGQSALQRAHDFCEGYGDNLASTLLDLLPQTR